MNTEKLGQLAMLIAQQRLWEEAEVYPRISNQLLEVSQDQVVALKLFSGRAA